MPKMRAIHKIIRRGGGKKQIVVKPGETFDCPEAEAQDYLGLKAAEVIEAGKPSAKKADPEPNPAPEPEPEPEVEADDSEADPLD